MKLLTLPTLALATVLLTACISDSSPEQEIMSPAPTSSSTQNESMSPSTPASALDSTANTTSGSDNTSGQVTNVIMEGPVAPTPTDTTSTPDATEAVPTTETPTTNETVTTTPEEATPESTDTAMATLEGELPAAQVEVLPWLRVPMHYEVLFGQSHIWGESGATQALNLATPALAESTTMELNSVDDLLPQQLISYFGADGEYYTAQIQSIDGKSLLLTTPLKQTVSAGANAWNFYSNGSHPNSRGYNAIADYAVRHLGKDKLNEGVHVLLGDSWFEEGSIFERLKQHLPDTTIFNKGIGGHTAADLLARFDEDVLPHTPNFVWILTSTNDYWQDVTVETYKANIDALIGKIKAANAVPIIFDASVGPLNSGSDTLTKISHAYVTAVEQLLAED